MSAKDILKRVIGIVFLSLGGLCLAMSIQMSLGLFLVFAPPNPIRSGLLMLGLLLLPGILFLLLGLFLWDWKRKKVLLGIISTILGGWFILVTFSWIFAKGSGLEVRTGWIAPIVSFVIALTFLSIGVLLIVQQNRIDQKNKQDNIKIT
ncbi:MAG: hypothetical protein QME81_08460 [bacterium]|nr:hypothetical protein [bacterium]